MPDLVKETTARTLAGCAGVHTRDEEDNASLLSEK
jgi:hypothetical protein